MKKLIILFLISAIISIVCTGCITTDARTNTKIPRQGLVFEMLFNGNLNETSGLNFTGTPFYIDFTADRFGVENHACKFNGDSSYIFIPDSKAFDFSNSDIAISAWVLFTNKHENATASYIMNFFCNGNYPHIEFYCNYPVPGQVGAHFLTDLNDPFEYRVTSEYPLINDGKWHHLVMQYYRRHKSAGIYIDGEQTASADIRIQGRLYRQYSILSVFPIIMGL